MEKMSNGAKRSNGFWHRLLPLLVLLALLLVRLRMFRLLLVLAVRLLSSLLSLVRLLMLFRPELVTRFKGSWPITKSLLSKNYFRLAQSHLSSSWPALRQSTDSATAMRL